MTTTTVQFTTVQFPFTDHATAWEFMRACDAADINAGFPALVAPWTVHVLIASIDELRIADRLDAEARGGK